ncbi:MAG: chromosome segregation protein SMC [Deltaproteobacteria bacterium]|nr:chromosome segregation protein SMC [Deltaproteobacteria bacterium]
MRLKSLELIGFKSFVDRTVIHFEEGVTGIVGPNGCGKSNVVDAIRWVMGEMSAKHLRGSDMQDVIFNGSETRQAMGMSQVYLTFDNSDGRAPADFSKYNEIQVGRRLYRSGESEYFINKTPCRLKDIIDLFLGTGVGTKAYSVVEQGMIGSIITAKPEDRRFFLEEAAGISKFKSRKEAALRKMEATRSNLARLNDIVAELQRQMNSLGRQVKKAERFQKLSEELRGRELAVAATRHRKLRVTFEQLEAEHAKLQEIEAGSNAELAVHETRLEEHKLAIASLEREVSQSQEELYAVQNSIKLHEASINHAEKEKQAIADRRVIATKECEELKVRVSTFLERIETMNQEKLTADIELASASELVQGKEANVAALKEARLEKVGACEEKRKDCYGVANTISQVEAKIEGLAYREQDIARRQERHQEAITRCEAQKIAIEKDLEERGANIATVKQFSLSMGQEAESLHSTLELQQENLSKSDETLAERRARLQDRVSRHQSLAEIHKNLEGYRDGVRAVLKRAEKESRGVMGTIADFIDTTPEYARAVSAALGDRLQHVVVASHEAGMEALEYLKTNALGRSSFIPMGLPHVAQQHAIPKGDGILGRLLDHVKLDEGSEDMGQYLLGDCILVTDLSTALRTWKEEQSGLTYVTLNGDVIDAFGCLTGGADTADASHRLIAQKKRIKELEDEIAKFRQEVATATADVTGKRERIRTMEVSLKELTSKAHSEELKAVNLDRDLEKKRAELQRVKEEIERVTREQGESSQETANVAQDIKTLRQKIVEHVHEKAVLEEKVRELEKLLSTHDEHLSSVEKNLLEFKVALAQVKERQAGIEREASQLLQLKVEAELGINRRTTDIEKGETNLLALNEESARLRQELDVAVTRAMRLTESLTGLRENYDKGQRDLREQELSIREVRKRHDEAREKVHAVALRLTEDRGRLQHLIENIRERYHLELPQIEQEYARDEAEFDLENESQAVEVLKEKIDGVGPVNVDAVKEFDELQERYDFLARQHTDLSQSLDGLEKAITKINRTSRKRFRETFDAVNSQFQELFPKLFRGGRAKLVLTDEENLLETGVEIIASPPGKKLQSITLLSGGEKALTAIALIFSIFLIKPSPFCLLDEVDAPLDDANVDRFNDMIRSMIGHSQFILITHNKRTMELADVLYGVTMEEAGASKMVSVRLNQAQEMVGETQTAVA